MGPYYALVYTKASKGEKSNIHSILSYLLSFKILPHTSQQINTPSTHYQRKTFRDGN